MTTRMLYGMLDMLHEFKHDKSSLMTSYVEQRLAKSFSQYDKELQQSLQILTRKHEKSILKRIAKIDNKSY